MASDTIQKILKLRDEASRPLLKMALAAQKAAGSVGDLDKDVAAFEKALASLDDEAKKAADGLDDVADSTDKVGTASKKAHKDNSAMAGFMGGMGAAAMTKAIEGAQALAKAYLGLGVSAVQVGAKMESFEARLSTLLGSTEAARDRLDELFKIGSTTPFELGQLVEAEATLVAFGVEADKWRKPVMDLAGSMNMDLVEAAQAVGRAFAGGAGAADILRDRGIMNLVQLQTGIKATEMSAKDFQAALFEVFTDPKGTIAGGTDKLAGTFSGLLSNLADAWFKFQKEIADAGLFTHAKAAVIVLLEKIGEGQDATKEWAGFLSTELVESFMTIAQSTIRIAQSLMTVSMIVPVIENAVRSVVGMFQQVMVVIGEIVLKLLELDVALGGAFSEKGPQQAEADLRAWEASLRDTKVALLENEQAFLQNRMEMQLLVGRIGEMNKASDVFDEIRAKAEELEKALQIEAEIKVNQSALNDLREQLGFGRADTGSFTVKGAAPTIAPKGTGKSRGAKELDALTKQVEGLVKKAFPVSQLDQAANLLTALESARDNARRSRKAAFDALIVDARRAKDQIEKVEIAKAFKKISREMSKDLASIESIAGGIEAGIAETIAAMEAAVADMWMALRESISKGVQGMVQSMTDLGGFIGGLGPEGAAVSALGGLGQQAAAQQDRTLSELEAAKDERARLRESGGSAAEMKANRDLIRTLEEQAEQGGMATLVEANVRGFVEGFKVLLQELPDVIGDVFPRLIGEGVPALIAGIIQATPKIAFAFLVRMPMAFAKGFVEGFKSVWDKIVSFFSRSFSAVISAISGGIIDEEGNLDVLEAGKAAGGAATGAAVGFAVGGPVGAAIGGLLGLAGGMAFQTGGVVNRTGMALVHANERILPTSGAVPQSARQMLSMGGGGGGPVIHIHTNVVDPNAIDALGRQLQRHFGSMGRATLPIFGGR